MESVSSLPWNPCPVSHGIDVHFGVEYAVLVYSRRVADMLLKPKVEQDTLALVNKRAAQV
jgi:hypothetical protein